MANRSLTPEQAGLILADAGSRPTPLKARNCAYCSNRFKPNKSSQRFCSSQCRERAKHVSRRQAQPEQDRRCVWCGSRISNDKRAHAIFCSDQCRKNSHSSRPCIYCGLPANSRDHFIPRSFTRVFADIGTAKKYKLVVPACLECNSTAGSEVFPTIREKRQYIHNRYKIRYAKLISMPHWTPEELEELGPTMRTHVASAVEGQRLLKARLRWPRR